MAEESFEDKTEKATPKKREEARKKGEVAKSRELPSVAVLLASLITLTIFGSFMYTHIQTVMRESFSLPILKEVNIPEFMVFVEKMITIFILTLSPILAAIFITAVLSNIMQVGFMLTGESIRPKLSRLNPIKGFGRLFSKQSFMELFKSLLKLAIVSIVAYLTVRAEMKNVYLLGDMEFNSIVAYILLTIFKIFIRCALAMIFLVAIDYAFQKWDFEKRLKMSKKEVKDEFKRTEGDPLIKSRIRSIQMQMARKRMMQDVPKADVVITNPTSLALALKYDSSVMGAPKLLAKGAGEIAKRIRELAEKYDIPVVENKDLAQSIYSLVEIGQEIPPALYEAVAEVLAYIYKLKGNVSSLG
ncbi:MAG: flagellar biosynthesis protein FlhB [Deltaproteobacteria bacterium]|nr:MAG: flagellar biosynthesis protein FlhB [Deltaproteobacteria bacterium]